MPVRTRVSTARLAEQRALVSFRRGGVSIIGSSRVDHALDDAMSGQLPSSLFGRRIRCAGAAIAIVLASAANAVDVRADDAAEADVQFEIATLRYRAGDWLGALEHFLASNRLSPNRRVTFNIARCYEQLDRRTEAYRAYDDALEGETDATQRATITATLARLAPTIALLDVVTDPPGATVYLQRKDLGSRGVSPRTLGVAAGPITVIAELPGYEPATSSEVTAVVGQVTRVALKLNAILGSISIEGPDIGADVRIDERASETRCHVPCSVDVAPGRRTVIVSKPGFADEATVVDVKPKTKVVVEPKLAMLTGSVIVSADFAESLIEVDGHAVGFTPTVLQVPVGKHVVRVSRAGFRAVESPIVVNDATETKLAVRLADAQEVVGASRKTESVADAPASITIIPGDELRAMGYPTIAEALRGVRGLYLTDDGAYVSLGVRGFSDVGTYGNRVLILVDGHSMNDDYVGSSYIGYDGRTDLADVERIEVIRGPGSVVYGTGAFFAVINLVTRERNAPTHVEAGISGGDASVVRARVHGTWRIDDDAGVWASVSAAYSRTGNAVVIPALIGTPGVGADGSVIGGDGFYSYTASAKAYKGPWSLQGMWTERQKNLPNVDQGSWPGSTTFRDTRGYLEGRFEPKSTGPVDSLTRVYGDTYLFHGVYPYPQLDGNGNFNGTFNTEVDDFLGLWAGVEQRFTWHIGPALSLAFGGELQRHFITHQQGHDDLNGTLIDRTDPFSFGALYAALDWTPTHTLRVSPAMRLDDYSTVGASLNPRLATIWRPDDDTVFKLLLGKAFRAPSVYELFYTSATQSTTGDVKPEDVYSAELEASRRFGDRTWVTLAAFTNYGVNLIELLGAGTTSSPNYYANSPLPILGYGVEAEVRQEWHDGWMISAQGSLEHSVFLNNDQGYGHVPNSPWLLAGIKGAMPIVGRALRLATRVSYVSNRWDRDDQPGNPAQTQTPAAIVWDVSLHGEADDGHIRYSLGVYNLADVRSPVPVSSEFQQVSYPQVGRTIMASLDLRR
jgi:outer membrane receptor protein involved in Fe transport